MKNVFSRGAHPLALTATQWLDGEGIDWNHEIRFNDMGSTCYIFFASKATPEKPASYYLKVSPSGVFKEIFEYESQEEWAAAINEKVGAFFAGGLT